MKKCLQMQNIKLSEIDILDDKYVYCSKKVGDEKFINSVEKFGILNPIVVEEKAPNLYRIISGVKRFFIAQSLRFAEIPSYIFVNENEFDALFFSIEENLSFRNLDEIEKANILTKLLNEMQANDAILKKFCELLKISFSEFSIRKYVQISNLPFDLKSKILENVLPTEAACNLAIFPVIERKIVENIFDRLKLNINLSKEMSEILKDLYKSETIDFLGFLSKLTGIRDDESFDNFKKIETIRKILFKTKFPILTQKEENFAEIKNKMLENLDQKKNVDLKYFPFFEREEYVLSLKFKDLQNFSDLKEMLAKLEKNLCSK